MSNDVRVHLRLGTLRLAYEGTRTFYETCVEPLVAAAAARSRGAAPAASPTVPSTSSADVAAPVGGGPAPRRAEAAAAPAFVPQSPEFGRFLRRLGPEAAEPDRQVVALAFYLWNYERRETFTAAEIRGCFEAVRMPAPADLPALFADLTERKRFLEAAGPDAWRLTKKGENYVKTRLLAS